jgi:hypothetical protein
MRTMIVAALVCTPALARAEGTDLGPFRASDDRASLVEMHATRDPRGDVSMVAAEGGAKVSCTRVATLRVGGALAEVWRATTKGVMASEAANAIVLAIHRGTNVLVSPVITASYGYKLGAYWTIDKLDVRLRAVGGAAVVDVATANTFHEQRTQPAEHRRWRSQALLTCPVDGSTTCSFLARGTEGEDCTATINADGKASFLCATTRELSLTAP